MEGIRRRRAAAIQKRSLTGCEVVLLWRSSRGTRWSWMIVGIESREGIIVVFCPLINRRRMRVWMLWQYLAVRPLQSFRSHLVSLLRILSIMEGCALVWIVWFQLTRWQRKLLVRINLAKLKSCWSFADSNQLRSYRDRRAREIKTVFRSQCETRRYARSSYLWA